MSSRHRRSGGTTELMPLRASLIVMGRGTGGGWIIVLAVVGALGLGGLTLLVVSADDRWSATPLTSLSDQDVQALVGSWVVMGDPTIDGREVRLHEGGRVSLRDGACVLGGGWSATGSGLMIMSIHSATNECRDLEDAFDYFTGVQRYDVLADALRLETLGGGTIAVLNEYTPPADPDETFVPHESAPELPAGVVVPALETLTAGRWIPVETVGSDRWPDAKRPHAQFDVDGTWHGSDGCNGLGGRWSMHTPTGEWLASTLGQTEIGCDNVDVSGMVSPARAVGMDGGELVFYGPNGTETGRFLAESQS